MDTNDVRKWSDDFRNSRGRLPDLLRSDACSGTLEMQECIGNTQESSAYGRKIGVYLPRDDAHPTARSFLVRAGRFWARAQIFLVRVQIFLVRARSFWAGARSFLVRARSFWEGAQSFLVRARSFWAGARSFLVRT